LTFDRQAQLPELLASRTFKTTARPLIQLLSAFRPLHRAIKSPSISKRRATDGTLAQELNSKTGPALKHLID
jgi:hypothetical protein